MKYLSCLLLLVFSFGGCIIVNTPGFYSGYKRLSPKEKARVIFTESPDDICGKTNDGKIYAITGKQLLRCMKNNDTSVVYFWSAHCSSDACITMQAAQRYCNKMNYKMYIVAEYYDVEMMARQHTIPAPLHIANHKYYRADYCQKYNKRFKADLLNGMKLPKDQLYGRFFFFKGDKFIFAGTSLIPATNPLTID